MAVRDVVQAAAGVGGGGEYVEDVFSTYLYAGNGSTQTIENGIDLDGEGGLVWIKGRDDGAHPHSLYDTERGVTKQLSTNYNSPENVTSSSPTQDFVSFNSNGFSLGEPWNTGNLNSTAMTKITSWSFRKSPKFFDVVTWTGDGNAGRTIAHNLGSVPGCIIVKSTSNSTNWVTYHRSTGASQSLYLNRTDAAAGNDGWNYTAPTSTEFTVGSYITNNASGYTYVAYLFAHNAGGFGDDGEQNVISCGSYVGTGTNGNFVSLGFEPQWVMIKNTGDTGQWRIFDNMRGVSTGGNSFPLLAENATAEFDTGNVLAFNATGFTLNGGNGNTNSSNATTYIYIAIRRGPMKVPTDGTEVYYYATQDATSPGHEAPVANWPVDFAIKTKTSADNRSAATRLLGEGYLVTNATDTFASNSDFSFDYQNGFFESTDAYSDRFAWMFRRAPGFFDVVAYTGTGSATTQAHNLGVAPQLLIIKPRSAVNNWWVLDVSSATARILNLDLAFDAAGATYFGDDTVYVAPTSSVFSIGSNGGVNGSGVTYVAYLFASCPGVSKVGSYTGTGADLNVDCGFSAGARFILIKRTDSTGDWYVWDSARGIVAGNDPYLLLNSTAAENTSTDYIDPLSSGFTVTSSAPAALNASGGSYIFLAIA